MKRVLCTILLVFTVTVLFTEFAASIPAFARRYDMSCNTCHAPIPKLKPYGEEFAGNGFQLADKESPRYLRETGDDMLSLMRELPLALRLEGHVRWLPDETGGTDFQTPYLLKLLSGGTIARDVSYYFYFFLGERGEVAGIEDAFVMFNNVFGTGIDITAGQFQVSDPLFKRELRLTLEDYQLYRTRPGNSSINLTYDRGLMLSYSLPTGTDIVIEILNGGGIGPAGEDRIFDSDVYKNTFWRISQDVSENIRIGGFAFFGKEKAETFMNTLWMAGPDMTLSLGPLELNAQYMERRDDEPGIVGRTGSIASRGAMGELIYSPDGDRSVWYGAALYNWVDGDAGIDRYHAATGHVSYLLARNLRLIGEYTYDINAKDNRFTIGFVSAF